LAVYGGPDSLRGPYVHVLDVQDVWAGTPARGRLWFKAPRGIRAKPGDRGLFFLWDRLGGATDGFIEESKARYGDKVWERIGPDSSSVYLLPFPTYAYPFEKDALVLRGQSAFPTSIPVDKLHNELLEYDATLQPQRLYKTVSTVARVRAERVDQGTRTEHGLVVERWVLTRFRRLEVYKGQMPDTLAMRYISTPRAPRFRKDDELILFLSNGPEGPFLEQGKRAVLHVVRGEVLEAARPLAEFVKSLRGS
jgi:hypothetical protein